MAAERKYRMTRLGRGSYLLPSNDAQTLWHIYSFEDGRSHGLDGPDRTWWSCAKFLRTFDEGCVSAITDMSELGYVSQQSGWKETASYMVTRRQAINYALKEEATA